MDIKDKVAIVTGAGSGIGKAIVERFHDEGARAIDVTDEKAIAKLVSETVEENGCLDIFVSNAGYVTQGGLEVENQEIQRMWEVHVMAHIYAARSAVPVMAANGGGYLLNTASAAGLLTQLGSMPYATTQA
ncbi:MAG: SDR family oxidoreductase, partial [Acidimicrobiales bacterium]